MATRHTCIVVQDGGVRIAYDPSPYAELPLRWYRWKTPPTIRLHLGLGLPRSYRDGTTHVVQIPLAFIALTAWTITLLVRRWVGLIAAAPCACTRCGYSLIGNESGTCPECGQRTLEKATPSSSHAPEAGVPGTRRKKTGFLRRPAMATLHRAALLTSVSISVAWLLSTFLDIGVLSTARLCARLQQGCIAIAYDLKPPGWDDSLWGYRRGGDATIEFNPGYRSPRLFRTGDARMLEIPLLVPALGAWIVTLLVRRSAAHAAAHTPAND